MSIKPKETKPPRDRKFLHTAKPAHATCTNALGPEYYPTSGDSTKSSSSHPNSKKQVSYMLRFWQEEAVEDGHFNDLVILQKLLPVSKHGVSDRKTVLVNAHK